MKFTRYCFHSVDFKAPKELRNPLSKTVLSKCSFIWNQESVSIWNDSHVHKKFVHQTCKYFSYCLHWPPVDFPLKHPVKWNFDVSLNVSLNRLWNKQSSCKWFEMLSSSYDVSVMYRWVSLWCIPITWYCIGHHVEWGTKIDKPKLCLQIFALMNKLWGVHCEDLGENQPCLGGNRPCHEGIALFLSKDM